MKTVCVFIDGENFRKTIQGLFPEFDKEEYLPKNADWTSFFDYLVAECFGNTAERLRCYWYVTAELDHTYIQHPQKDRAKFIKRLEGSHYESQINQLSDVEIYKELPKIHTAVWAYVDKVKKRFNIQRDIQNAIGRNAKGIEFRRNGSLKLDPFTGKFLGEKGVDVALGVDLLKLKDIYDCAILVSGDQDYVPAVQAVKDCGKEVFNVSFKTRTGELLPGGARRLNDITDHNLQVDFAICIEFLGINPDGIPPVQP